MELNKPLRSAYFFGELNIEEEIKPVFSEETITSYRVLKKRLVELDKANYNNIQVVLFFMGSEDKNGKSWCADCNIVEDMISYIKDMIGPSGYLIRVHVGNRVEWLKSNNPFKKDPKLHIKCIPAIWVWNTLKRVSGRKLLELENLVILLED